MTHETLFNEYQRTLEWINRRLEPDVLKFYGEDADTWKHAKEIAFSMYENLRYSVDGGVPLEAIEYDSNKYATLPPYVFENGYECKVEGMLRYRDHEYPVYDDDYGMSNFIVVDGRTIQVCSFGGPTDWYYEIDRIIDKI